LLSEADFTNGGLRQASNVRPNRLFTADSSSILYRAGCINTAKMDEVLAKLTQIFMG
jgi:mRNA interferase MazF